MKCQKCDSIINNGELVCNICGTLNSNISDTSSKIAWENSEEIGIIKSFFQTVYAVFVKPSTIFSNITDDSSIFKALLFAIIAGAIGEFGDVIWQTLFIKFPSIIPQSVIPSTVVDTKEIITYAPVIVLTRVALLTLYTHFILMITGAKKRNFKATAIGVSYIQAVSILSLISPVGNLSGLWGFFLLVFMTSRLHKISGLRSFSTIMLPPILLLGLLVTLIVLFIGSAVVMFYPMLKYLLL